MDGIQSSTTLQRASHSGLRLTVGRFWLPLAALLFPAVLLMPGLATFPYPTAELLFSDLSISHYPNTLFLQRSLFEQGQVPLWSPLILSGYPFAADPLSGLWYPPGWLALLLPLPLGLNVMIAAHLVWGGAGMYRLLRAEGLAREAALVGAVAFGGLPKLMAHYGAGHVTLLYAVPWTPWLLYAAANSLKASEENEGWQKLSLWPGVILGLIVLADPRWGAYAGAAWVIYYFAGCARFAHSQSLPASLHKWLRLGAHIAVQIGFAVLVAAPLLVPLAEFTRLSTRTNLAASDILLYSLPPVQLSGLLFPELGVMHEWILYSGAAIFLLCLLALLIRPKDARMRFWAVLAGLTLLYAFGSSLPFLEWIANIPGVSLMRVPSRSLFLTGVAIAALSAYSFTYLQEDLSPTNLRRARLLTVGLGAFAVVLVLAVGLVARKWLPNVASGAAAMLAASIWVGLRLGKRLSTRLWWLGLLALVVLDLGIAGWGRFASFPEEAVLGEQRLVAEYLAKQPGTFRVYSPSYSLPQQVAAYYELEQADGVDPLQLRDYVDFMQDATGIPPRGYSVTLPSFSGSGPAVDNAAYRPDPEQLGLLNVGYVVSEFDLPVEGLALEAQIGRTRVYANQFVKPRAWVQSLSAEIGEGAEAVGEVEWRPNRIELDIQPPAGPAEPYRLVVAEVNYPGWQAQVDGEPVEMETAAGLLRSVILPPGTHRVTFLFRPVSVKLGLGLGLSGWALVSAWAWIGWRRRREEPATLPAAASGSKVGEE